MCGLRSANRWRDFSRDPIIVFAIMVIALGSSARAQPACIISPAAPNVGAVNALYDLQHGDVLISAVHGVFRFDSATSKIVPIDGPATGSASGAFRLSDATAAIGADQGLFKYDDRTKRLSVVDGGDIGSVYAMHPMPSGDILVGADKGLFRIELLSERAVPIVGSYKPTGALHGIFDVPGDDALIDDNKGFFRFDHATAQTVQVQQSSMQALIAMNDPLGGVLFGTALGVFRLDPPGAIARQLHRLSPNAILAASTMLKISEKEILIGADSGFLLFDSSTLQIRNVDGDATGAALAIHRLPTGDVLVGANRGWFRFDAASQRLSQISDVKVKAVVGILDLTPIGTIIGTDQGLLHFTSFAEPIVPIGWQQTGGVYVIRRLANNDILLGTARGSFRFVASTRELVLLRGDAVDHEVVPIRRALLGIGDTFLEWDPFTSQVRPIWGNPQVRPTPEPPVDPRIYPSPIPANYPVVIHPLSERLALIGGGSGLSLVPLRPLQEAKFTPVTSFAGLVPSRFNLEFRTKFEHPCAPVVADLGLSIVAAVNGIKRPPVSISYPIDSPPTEATATLQASAMFDVSGTWTLSLEQDGKTIGEPIRFTVLGPSIVQRLTELWPVVLAVASALYVLAFGALLWLTHQSVTAFRMLAEPGWGRLITWPFFFLRYAPTIQVWVLEPWFQAVRRNLDFDALYFDPPVFGAAETEMKGSALLRRLGATRRIWLQGQSGMGKSSVFDQCERTFFLEPTLADAVRRFGFVLITLRIRHYASLDPPEANRPESWILESVRRRLEEHGFATRDLSLIDAFLKAGRIALALDGANEADRDAALVNFARQFSQARILATSQAFPRQLWELWKLPKDLEMLREKLLSLWLGPESGSILSRRIKDEGLSAAIVSGYDLLLIADLARNNPISAPLPHDRVALYKAMLANARDANGQPLKLDELKHLAWTMVAQRRRNFLSSDDELLRSQTLKASTEEGFRVVRQVGTLYEFRHDQMRSFLAALWLVEETPSMRALDNTAADGGVFSLNRRDQEELWRFVVALLQSDENIKELWSVANGDPVERAILIAALQAEADVRDITLVRAVRRRGRRKK